MRWPLLIGLISIVIPKVFSVAPSLDEILLTNQYLLVSSYGCSTQFEANVTAGLCPQIFQKPPGLSESTCFTKIHRTHLLRDPDAQKPPLLGILSGENGLIFHFYEINEKAIFGGKETRKWWKVEQEPLKKFYLQSYYPKTTKIYSLYDTMSQIVYVLSIPENGAGSTFMSFYISDLFNEKRALVRQPARRLDPKNYGRFEWTEDVYENKVYYKEKNGELTTTYMIDMDRILPTLLEGEPGRAVMTTTDNWGYLSYTGGMISEIRVETTEEDSQIISTMRPVKQNLTSRGIQCQYSWNGSKPIAHQPIVIIRDNDYCLLRGIDSKECESQKLKWLTDMGLMSEDGISLENWLKVIIIILIMLIVLLFIYIYWLRSTFVIEDSDEGAAIRYGYSNENEASLFINRQRSFPTSYADAGPMDVSVDRWN